jgi:hypothetical protein
LILLVHIFYHFEALVPQPIGASRIREWGFG